MENVRRCNITVNRACNLRCQWCYAKGTGFSSKDNMPIETFKKIVEFLKGTKVKTVALIGGEPTMYPYLKECIKELKGFNISLVTNGILLADLEKCKELISDGITSISLSIKAENEDKYNQLTGSNLYKKALKAIKNLVKLKAKFSVSYVITNDNIDGVKEMVKRIKKCGCQNFFFSFCRNFNLNQDHNYSEKNNPMELIKKFEELLPWLKKNVKEFKYSVNDPLCLFSPEFLDEYLKDFYFPCYVHTNSAITFDQDGYVIPCNTIHQLKLGKIGVDFDTFEEYIHFQKTDLKYINIYKKLKGLPSLSCKKCDLYLNCQGRCITNWTNYSFEKLQSLKKDAYFKNHEEPKILENKKYRQIFNEICTTTVSSIDIEKKYKVIIGWKKYSKKTTHSVSNFNSIYSSISNGNVAFFTRNKVYPSSLIYVLNFIFDSLDFVYFILDYLFWTNQINNLIHYLIEKGYVFINIDDVDLSGLFNINIESAIICGKHTKAYTPKQLNDRKCIERGLVSRNVPTFILPHPSAFNLDNIGHTETWVFHDTSSKKCKCLYSVQNINLKSFIL